MAVKFSQFTTRTGTLDASTMIVGYDDPAGTKTNVEISLATLKANLDNIYTSDGTIGTTRVVGITDTLTFEESSGNVDMFKMNVDGTFSLGLNSINYNSDSVVIGKNAFIGSGKYNNVVIGADANSGSKNECVIVGHDAEGYGSNAVAVGSHAHAPTTGISIGAYAGDATAGGNSAINIGYVTRGSGANSITISAAVPGSGVIPSTANAFGVYMTSASTPDFVVIGGGESTLNTNLKITGQAYTELHTGATIDGVDWDSGNVQEVTLSAGSSDFDPSNAKAGATYILKITQPSGGNGTINWDNIGAANIKWPGGTEPTLTATNAAVDIVTLICTDATGQGVYYANATLNFS